MRMDKLTNATYGTAGLTAFFVSLEKRCQIVSA
ncbi:hypothetical protein EB1316870_17255 [Proteus mirabilis]